MGAGYAALTASQATWRYGHVWRAVGGVVQLLCLWSVLGVDACLALLMGSEVDRALLWCDR